MPGWISLPTVLQKGEALFTGGLFIIKKLKNGKVESHSTPPFVLEGAAAGLPQQRHISREYSNNVDILKVKVDTTFSNGHNEVIKSGDNGDCTKTGISNIAVSR